MKIIVCILCFASSFILVRADQDKKSAPETSELVSAIAMANAKLQATVDSPATYKLIKVELASVEGEYVWRTTYKLNRLLPKIPAEEPLGAGGEVFITVNLKNGQIVVRYGE